MRSFRSLLLCQAAGLALMVGVAGCYVPNGGWTLRTGVDCRTHRKPACFLEMVDTRWDEWNRVAQVNAMQPWCESGWQTTPPPGQPTSGFSEPLPLPPVSEQPTSQPGDRPLTETAARPAGAWLFQR